MITLFTALIRKYWGNSFYRFLIIGALNTVFGYSIYACGIFFGLHYTIAVLVAYIIGTLFSFNTIGRLVFRNYRHGLVFRFVALYSILYLVNVFVIKFLSHLGLNYYEAGLFGTGIAAMVSYLFNKHFIFK